MNDPHIPAVSISKGVVHYNQQSTEPALQNRNHNKDAFDIGLYRNQPDRPTPTETRPWSQELAKTSGEPVSVQ